MKHFIRTTITLLESEIKHDACILIIYNETFEMRNETLYPEYKCTEACR